MQVGVSPQNRGGLAASPIAARGDALRRGLVPLKAAQAEGAARRGRGFGLALRREPASRPQRAVTPGVRSFVRVHNYARCAQARAPITNDRHTEGDAQA